MEAIHVMSRTTVFPMPTLTDIPRVSVITLSSVAHKVLGPTKQVSDMATIRGSSIYDLGETIVLLSKRGNENLERRTTNLV